MRVFAVSDLHVDYLENKKWVARLSNFDYQQDVLILAGDLTDNLPLLGETLSWLVDKFNAVFYVPGNHELWVSRDQYRDSITKFKAVCQLAVDSGAKITAQRMNGLVVYPLFSWYDFSFAEPNEKILQSWVDFRACRWPDGWNLADVNHYFLAENKLPDIRQPDDFVVSYSHFLPRIDVMPFYIPLSQRYIYPVLGSDKLDRQIRQVKPNIHVYGHSHVNQQISLNGIEYINNAFGYPNETRIASKNLLCIYEK
ncbi:metallophosphoesterase family protein [Aliikangiella maris]|uniref:Metallophosphoesterase n=2 Tax=Aliikangiella maris TaxID=3162458 RepID=A0ABV3MPP2_9GAMM